ncbi:MAG TPA: DUF4115 domain-containing protein [Acetobacteraceae bacterium]|jgi:cytoskeleton protein RodZ
MPDDQDEDEMFERLAKSLRAVRQDAELVRSSGSEAISAGLARTDADLRSLVTGVEALRQHVIQQQAVIVRLEAAAAKSEADLQGLRQTVEALSRRMLEQAELLARPSARKPPRRAAGRIAIALAVLVLVLGGGAAAWIASGREPTLGALVHQFVDRLSELSGIDLAGLGKLTPPVRTVAHATPGVPPPSRQAPTAPAAPVPADPPPAAVVAPAETHSVASALPVGTAPVAPDLPGGQAFVASQPRDQTPAAVTPVPAQTPAVLVPPLAQTSAGMSPPSVMSAPAAAAPIVQAAAPAPAATALAQPQRPQQAARALVLRAISNAWVQVRQKDGQVLLSRTLKPGESWPVPAEPDLILDSGNVEGLVLEVDGVPARLTGAAGGVIHNVPLDGDVLRSGAAVRAVH